MTGSQGFNLYAYVANNPTLWVDPSGHDVGGYAGTLQFLPTVSPGVAVMASSLSTLIALTLAVGRNAASWAFGEHRNTSMLVLTVFALVLACGVIEGCMGYMRGVGNTATQLGSDAAAGVMAWTAASLASAWSKYPVTPGVVAPAPTIDPGPVSPAPNPSPKGPPGWFWPAVLLAALEAVSEYLQSTPGRGPWSGPGPGPGRPKTH